MFATPVSSVCVCMCETASNGRLNGRLVHVVCGSASPASSVLLCGIGGRQRPDKELMINI